MVRCVLWFQQPQKAQLSKNAHTPMFENFNIVRASFLQFKARIEVKMLISPWMFTWWSVSERSNIRFQEGEVENFRQMLGASARGRRSEEGPLPRQGEPGPLEARSKSSPSLSLRSSPGHSQMPLKPGDTGGSLSGPGW